MCTSALLPSSFFLAFCRFLPKLQPVWVVGGQLSNWAASLTSSVINRAKSGRFFFVHFASSHATQRVHSKGSGGTKWGLGHTPPAPDVRSHASYSTSLLTSRGIITIIILNIILNVSPYQQGRANTNTNTRIILNVSPYQQGHAQAARARGRGCSATTRGNVPPLKSTPVPAPISSTRMSTSTTTADFDSPIVISF